AVSTFIPSSHGRTHDAARTRPPVSTIHMRQTPTGRIFAWWHRTGMSMPRDLAASHTLVPGGTVTGRLSIVSVTLLIKFIPEPSRRSNRGRSHADTSRTGRARRERRRLRRSLLPETSASCPRAEDPEQTSQG